MNTHRRAATAIAALMLSFALFVIPARADWSSPVDISPSVSGQPDATGDGDSAGLPDGGFVYVWGRPNTDETTDVVSRVSYPDGTLSPINTIAEGSVSGPAGDQTTIDAVGPTVDAGADGTIRVGWSFMDEVCDPGCASRYRTATATLGPDGKVLSTEILQSTVAGDGDYVSPMSISVADDGHSLMAWRFNDSSESTRQIRYAIAAPGGDPVVKSDLPTSPASSALESPKVAAAAGGGGLIAYNRAAPIYRIEAFMVGPDGAPTEPRTIAQAGQLNTLSIQPVIDARGVGTVVFWAYEASDPSYVALRQLDADGDLIGSEPTLISDDVASRPATLAPQGAATSLDRVVVVFSQAYDETGITGLFSRVVQAGGAVGQISPVAKPEGVYAYAGSVAISPKQDGSVLYVAAPDGPGKVEIQVRPLGSSLAPVGPLSVVGEQLADSTIYPTNVAYSRNGDASALWADYLEDEFTKAGYRAAYLDDAGPAVEIDVPARTVVGETVNLSATAVDRSRPVSFVWNFGDGASADTASASHVYVAEGVRSVTLTATDAEGHETEVEAEITVDAKVVPPVIRPNTRIKGKPAKRTRKRVATFRFVSSLPGSRFQCRLDGKRWAACKSPKKLKRLKPGRHVFRVRADKNGIADKTPATYRWTVKKTKKRGR